MQPVDVLRPLALGEFALGPRELEVDVGVKGVLRPRHGEPFRRIDPESWSNDVATDAGATPSDPWCERLWKGAHGETGRFPRAN
jgi:hypothetical protein